jgi:hypothetical protein
MSRARASSKKTVSNLFEVRSIDATFECGLRVVPETGNNPLNGLHPAKSDSEHEHRGSPTRNI